MDKTTFCGRKKPRSGSALGQIGENFARDYLAAKGMKFVEANWRCRAGEIDLVFMDGNELVFVEVKSRRAGIWARQNLFLNITEFKKRKLRMLAQLFLHERVLKKRWGRRYPPLFRIDVVGVIVSDENALIELEHATGAI